MNPAVALLGLCGLGFGVGLLLLIRAWQAPPAPTPGRWGRRLRRLQHDQHNGPWLAAAVTVGILAGAVTGWVVGALLAAMATWGAPRAIGPDRAHQRHVARIEALAGWTEMLRDTLAAAAGLEQTIVATAHTAPPAIRPEIRELAARIESGERLSAALRRVADDLADPIADLVVAVLLLAAEHQGRQLAPLLGELAQTARSQVEMRGRVEVSRARMRTTVRVIVATTAGFAGALVVFNPVFLEPYGTASGQLVLLAIGAIFTWAFVWLRHMAIIDEPERFLTELPGVPDREEAYAPKEVRP